MRVRFLMIIQMKKLKMMAVLLISFSQMMYRVPNLLKIGEPKLCLLNLLVQIWLPLKTVIIYRELTTQYLLSKEI